MRLARWAGATTAVIAWVCASCAEPTAPSLQHTTPMPPVLWPSASAQVVEIAGGGLGLQVSVWLVNRFQVGLSVQTSPVSCAPYIVLFPDSAGAVAVGASGSTPIGPSTDCEAGGQELSIAPGDSAELTRTIPADSLPSLAQGTYGVNVYIFGNDVTGCWAGTVQLPLQLPG